MRTVRFVIALLVPLAAVGPARADRVILAPSGRIVAPGDVHGIDQWRTSGFGQFGRLHLGVPKDDLGLELELDRLSGSHSSVETLALQYSIISEAFTNNLAPAVSVGVLDLPNRGLDGRAWYVSLSKTFGLSELQERWMSLLRVHAGYGSHRMGGAYLGVSVRIAGILDLSSELYRRRFNAGARLRVAGPVGIVAQTHDGTTWAGLDVVIIR